MADLWTPWKRHHGGPCPVPPGLPVQVRLEGGTIRDPEICKDGPWWGNGRGHTPEGRLIMFPRITSYRERRYEAGIMLIRRLTNGGENA